MRERATTWLVALVGLLVVGVVLGLARAGTARRRVPPAASAVAGGTERDGQQDAPVVARPETGKEKRITLQYDHSAAPKLRQAIQRRLLKPDDRRNGARSAVQPI